jgi:uncharacterized integral membrane protein
MKIFTLLALLIAIAAVVFASQNALPVTIYLLGWNYQASMALVVLLTFSLGVLMGFLLSLPRMVYRMTKIANLKRTVAEQDSKIAELEQKLLEAAKINNSLSSQPRYSDAQPYNDSQSHHSQTYPPRNVRDSL